jgi:hypothetical protein
MREQFGGLLGRGDHGAPFLPRVPRPTYTALMNSPGASTESSLDSGLPNVVDLPNREKAMVLCENALNLACSLLRFVHQPSFYDMVNRVYEVPVENFTNDENQFLPLLYMVLALGCMFRPQDTPLAESESTSYKTGIDEG